jgi:hypothetical protein
MHLVNKNIIASFVDVSASDNYNIFSAYFKNHINISFMKSFLMLNILFLLINRMIILNVNFNLNISSSFYIYLNAYLRFFKFHFIM